MFHHCHYWLTNLSVNLCEPWKTTQHAGSAIECGAQTSAAAFGAATRQLHPAARWWVALVENMEPVKND